MTTFSCTSIPFSRKNSVTRPRPVPGGMESTEIALRLKAPQLSRFEQKRVSLSAFRILLTQSVGRICVAPSRRPAQKRLHLRLFAGAFVIVVQVEIGQMELCVNIRLINEGLPQRFHSVPLGIILDEVLCLGDKLLLDLRVHCG